MATRKSATPKIVKDNPKEQKAEILASAIIEISRSFQAWQKSELTEEAIILLIQNSCPGRMTKMDIRNVLIAAANLEKDYIKPKKG